MTKSGAVRRPLWLIAKEENGLLGVLTLDPGSKKEALPVFSHEEEAETFLRLATPGTCWRARKTTSGELILLLYGSCAGVERVALDPLPVVDGETVIDLTRSGRDTFVHSFMGDREPSAARERFRAEVFISPDLLRGERGTLARDTEGNRKSAEKGGVGGRRGGHPGLRYPRFRPL